MKTPVSIPRGRVRIGLTLGVLAVLAAGCADDPSPVHVDGEYSVHCADGCTARTFLFRGDNGGDNSLNTTGEWPDIHARCRIQSLGGGVTSLTGFVSNQPLDSSNDAGRAGIEIVNTVMVDDDVDAHRVRLYDQVPFEAGISNDDPTLSACVPYEITLLENDSFQVDFDCPTMTTQFAFDPRIAENGHIIFANCS